MQTLGVNALLEEVRAFNAGVPVDDRALFSAANRVRSEGPSDMAGAPVQVECQCGFQDRMSRGCPLSHAFQDSCRVVFQVGSVADRNLQVRVDSQPSRSAPPELLRRF